MTRRCKDVCRGFAAAERAPYEETNVGATCRSLIRWAACGATRTPACESNASILL